MFGCLSVETDDLKKPLIEGQAGYGACASVAPSTALSPEHQQLLANSKKATDILIPLMKAGATYPKVLEQHLGSEKAFKDLAARVYVLDLSSVRDLNAVNMRALASRFTRVFKLKVALPYAQDFIGELRHFPELRILEIIDATQMSAQSAFDCSQLGRIPKLSGLHLNGVNYSPKTLEAFKKENSPSVKVFILP